MHRALLEAGNTVGTQKLHLNHCHILVTQRFFSSGQETVLLDFTLAPGLSLISAIIGIFEGFLLVILRFSYWEEQQN